MLPTPSTSHVCFDRVYEPAEDSYLLLDTLSSPSEIAFLHNRFSSSDAGCPLALEVGVGSGVVLAFIAANAKTIFGRDNVLTLGTDLNRFACRDAAQTVRNALKPDTESQSQESQSQEQSSQSQSHTSIFLDTINADLASSIRPHSIDILVFNPPYVPADLPDYSTHQEALNALSLSHSSTPNNQNQKPTFEQDSYLLELSYAGGDDGMVVTNRMLEQIPEILSEERGVGYLLLCAQNKPEVVKEGIRSWGEGWRAETVGSSGKKAGWEKLQIVRIWRESV